MPERRLIVVLVAVCALCALLPASASAQRPPRPGPGAVSNDNFADATRLEPFDSGTINLTNIGGGSTIGATEEPGEPNHAGDPGGSSVWYAFTPKYPGRYRVTLEGWCDDGWPGLFAIYSGSSLSGLTSLASARRAPEPSCEGYGSASAEVTLGTGQTYRAAIDGAGGAEVGDFSFQLSYLAADLPPETKIDSARIRSGRRQATFRFSGSDHDDLEDQMTFQCKLDKRPWGTCRSPRTYRRLSIGRHTFRVRSKNDGEVDPTPAKRIFRIRRT